MSTTAAQPGALPARDRPSFMSSLWTRRLDHYPDTGARYFQLGLVVLVTVILYYQNYVGGAVGPQILGHFSMSFTYYVTALAIANLVGALGSLAAGLADRLGRANLVVYGVLLTGLLTLFAIPNAGSKFVFVLFVIIIGLVEGVILVATPALVRDFSPQVGRATAMGFWTMGPVLGSLVVSVVATNTLSATNPSYVQQFRICGVVGMVVFVIAFVGLRELSPQLRDQLMVSLRERELVEARARGLDIEASLKNPFRQMFKPDVVLSALGISVFLLIYYTLVAFGVIYFESRFNFTGPDANGVSNYAWGADAIGLLAIGLISDRLRVRKPLMLIGGIFAAVMMVVYLSQATNTHESYYGLALILALLALALAMAYAPWMASFTETVEARNPALTATGLAVWGLLIRLVIFVSFLIIPHVVSSVTPIVNYGPKVEAAVAQVEKAPLVRVPYAVAPQPLLTVVETHQATFAALAKYPTASAIPPAVLASAARQVGTPALLAANQYKAPLTVLAAHGTTVQNAQAQTGNQWKNWYWVCFGGMIAFLPVIFLLKGRWSPGKAKADADEHDARIKAELAELHQQRQAAGT